MHLNCQCFAMCQKMTSTNGFHPRSKMQWNWSNWKKEEITSFKPAVVWRKFLINWFIILIVTEKNAKYCNGKRQFKSAQKSGTGLWRTECGGIYLYRQRLHCQSHPYYADKKRNGSPEKWNFSFHQPLTFAESKRTDQSILGDAYMTDWIFIISNIAAAWVRAAAGLYLISRILSTERLGLRTITAAWTGMTVICLIFHFTSPAWSFLIGFALEAVLDYNLFQTAAAYRYETQSFSWDFLWNCGSLLAVSGSRVAGRAVSLQQISGRSDEAGPDCSLDILCHFNISDSISFQKAGYDGESRISHSFWQSVWQVFSELWL